MARTDFQRIEVGDVIEMREDYGDSMFYKPHMVKWKVMHVYPHHIECVSESTGVTTSFTYGEMVQLGYEVEPQVME